MLTPSQILFHLVLNNSYGPLVDSLPLSFADKMAAAPAIAGTGTTAPQANNAEGAAGNGQSNEPARAGYTDANGANGVNGANYENAGHMTADIKKREAMYEFPTQDRHVGGPTGHSTSPIEEFAHPASIEQQQIIWIPHDPLGLGESEAAANAAQGIEVSMDGATMDPKGRVDVDRPPPGEQVA